MKPKILDVGGGTHTFEKATHVMDVIPKPKGLLQDYIQFDICSGKWPFKDKEFDWVYCSNVLEDIKDPAAVCKEIIRVGKAGTIIVPSPYLECRKGVDNWPGNKDYAGFVHHRWVCFNEEEKLKFIQKTPITYIFDWTKGITDEDINKKAFLIIEWKDDFKFEEVITTDWNVWYNMLKDFFGINPMEGK